MWLLVTFLAALFATFVFVFKGKKHNLDFLSLMLWGTFIMVLIDHVLGFLYEGGDFIEYTTSGLIPNSFLLGLVMLVPILFIWAVSVIEPFGIKIWAAK